MRSEGIVALPVALAHTGVLPPASVCGPVGGARTLTAEIDSRVRHATVSGGTRRARGVSNDTPPRPRIRAKIRLFVRLSC